MITPYETTPQAIANACWYTSAATPETLALPEAVKPYSYPEWAAWTELAKAADACLSQFMDGGEFLALPVTIADQPYTLVCIDWEFGGFDRPALFPGHPSTLGAALRMWLNGASPVELPADHAARDLFLTSAA